MLYYSILLYLSHFFLLTSSKAFKYTTHTWYTTKGFSEALYFSSDKDPYFIQTSALSVRNYKLLSSEMIHREKNVHYNVSWASVDYT